MSTVRFTADLVQHPELMTPRAMPNDLIQMMKERHVIGGMLASTITVEAWTKHLKAKADAEKSPPKRRTIR